MKIVILGTGNMGSIFAARLIQAGHEVLLVARNERLRELLQNGLRIQHQYSGKLDHFSPEVFPELTPDMEADLILVMVQHPHVGAIMPALTQHPCQRICFMFNCSEMNPAWQEGLGKRLVWGFPSALAGTKDGIVRYLFLPGWLRFLQITTVGVTEGGDSQVAKTIVEVLNKSKIAAAFHPDMRSWLMSHTGLMLPGMILGESKHKAGQKQALTWAEARKMMQAQKECFSVVQASEGQVTPLNMRLLTFVPGFMGAIAVWLLSRTPAYAQAVVDHVDHGHDEMLTMFEGIKTNAARTNTPTPALDALGAMME